MEFKEISRDLIGVNPLSPGVLDPGNYPGGGPQDPQLYSGFLGLFIPPSINVEPHI